MSTLTNKGATVVWLCPKLLDMARGENAPVLVEAAGTPYGRPTSPAVMGPRTVAAALRAQADAGA